MDHRRCPAEPGFTETYREHQALRRTFKEKLHRNWARVSYRITASTSIYSFPPWASFRSAVPFLPGPSAEIRTARTPISPKLSSSTRVARNRGRYHRRLLQLIPPSDCSPPPPAKLSRSLRSSRLLSCALNTTEHPPKNNSNFRNC